MNVNLSINDDKNINNIGSKTRINYKISSFLFAETLKKKLTNLPLPTSDSESAVKNPSK